MAQEARLQATPCLRGHREWHADLPCAEKAQDFVQNGTPQFQEMAKAAW
jgi:hypothetical protein